MNEVEVLILSNTLDLSTDFVCLELNRRGVRYARINRNLLPESVVQLDLVKGTLSFEIGGSSFLIRQNTLKSVYYRAPIYLRDTVRVELSPEEQLSRSQWMAFVRNLSIFEDAIWVNHPVSTFRAENKILQLQVASSLGLSIPHTIVTNGCDTGIEKDKTYIVKSLDTGLLRFGDSEAFIYANVVNGSELACSENMLAPYFIQEYIQPKIDVRVTVIGDSFFAVNILKDGTGVPGDWRKVKDKIDFVPVELPPDVAEQCVMVVKSLGLSFGGIDLIESDGKYFFIEVNPTGEWGWLVSSAQLPIPEAICNFLEGNS